MNMRNGFVGLLSLLVTIGVIAFLVSGGWYYTHKTPSGDVQDPGSQSLLQFGKQKIKEAEVLKQKIEEQQKRLQADFDEENQQTGIVFGNEADKRCGPQPPILCRPGMPLGCRIMDKQWDCYPVGSSVDISTWKIYRNEKYGFEIKHPVDWNLVFESANGVEIASVSKDTYVHGLGIPEHGGMQVGIYKMACKQIRDNFESDQDSPGLHSVSKTICMNGFQIHLGYTDDVRNPLPKETREKNENILHAISSTFH